MGINGNFTILRVAVSSEDLECEDLSGFASTHRFRSLYRSFNGPSLDQSSFVLAEEKRLILLTSSPCGPYYLAKVLLPFYSQFE